MSIEPGLVGEFEKIVEEGDTARFTTPELPPVLATPRLIGFMEWAAHLAVADELAETQTTVGSKVNISHLAATPAGMRIRCAARLVEVDSRRLRFTVEAWDEVDKIGEGEHERFIIDRTRFQQRLDEKIQRAKK